MFRTVLLPFRRRSRAVAEAKASAPDVKDVAEDGRGEHLGLASGGHSYDHTWNYSRLGKRR